MLNGFLVKKLDMTQEYEQDGKLVAVTKCQALPCVIIGLVKKDWDEDSCWVQLGAGERKNPNQPLQGMIKKAGLKKAPAIIREFIWQAKDKPKLGEKVSADQVFEPKMEVDVVGISKGRGFTGVVKRWNFKTQPRTHGQKQRWRAPGSIGPQTPGRVIKGKKMPGHHGNQQITVKNLTVLDLDKKNNQLLIKGALPGPKGAWLQLFKAKGN